MLSDYLGDYLTGKDLDIYRYVFLAVMGPWLLARKASITSITQIQSLPV